MGIIKEASEFGGKAGLVQSEEDGHTMTAAEQLSAVNQERE